MSSPGQGNKVLCIGAGIIGLATARALLQENPGLEVTVLEAEPKPALHQTGRNSGVLHSGLYYKPGSLKAQNCVTGRREMVSFCEEHQVPFELCGKLVIATDKSEIPRLEELEKRGRANGLSGMKRVGPEEIREHEPHATGIDALWIPETGIVDYKEVANTYARLFQSEGGELKLGTRVTGIRRTTDEITVETDQGEFSGRYLINCAGLQCDRIARMAGSLTKVRIVPFRGDYFDIKEERRNLLRGLIYPVPDPRFPFLGVHLTRRINGTVEAGPNAVLSFHREGYTARAFRLNDTASTLSYLGFWRLAARFWKIGLQEYVRAGSRKKFAQALQRFVPEIGPEDLTPGGCGIRAQALDPQGKLLDDFALEGDGNTLHVLNAPSPGATASLSIGRSLAQRALGNFDL